MRQRVVRQRQLFDEDQPWPSAQLPQEVRQEAMRLLAQWMQALAEMINEEADDEPDQR